MAAGAAKEWCSAEQTSGPHDYPCRYAAHVTCSSLPYWALGCLLAPMPPLQVLYTPQGINRGWTGD